MYLRQHPKISVCVGLALATLVLYLAALFLGLSVAGEFKIATTTMVMLLLCAFASYFFINEAALAEHNPVKKVRQALKNKSPITLLPGLALATMSSYALWRLAENWNASAYTNGEQTVMGVLLAECACLGIGFSLWIQRGKHDGKEI